MNSKEYAELIMEREGLKTTYMLAKYLQVPPQTVGRWMKRQGTIGDSLALKVADILGLPAALVMADMNAERATDPAVAAEWHALADSISAGNCWIPQAGGTGSPGQNTPDKSSTQGKSGSGFNLVSLPFSLNEKPVKGGILYIMLSHASDTKAPADAPCVPDAWTLDLPLAA